MSNEIIKNEKTIEYVPFGSSEAIKLSLSIVRSYIANPTKSGKLPTDRDIMNFIMLCKSRELNPFEGDAYLVGYDTQNGPSFSLITSHQAFLKRGVADPDFDGMESGVVIQLKDGTIKDRESDFMIAGETLLGGWARVHSKIRAIPIYRRINLENYDKGFGLWKTNKAMMIVKCAEADALRSAYPNKVGDLYLREEIEEKQEYTPIAMPELTQDETTEPETGQDETIAESTTKDTEKEDRCSESGYERISPDVLVQIEAIAKRLKKDIKEALEAYGFIGELKDLPAEDGKAFADFLKE